MTDLLKEIERKRDGHYGTNNSVRRIYKNGFNDCLELLKPALEALDFYAQKPGIGDKANEAIENIRRKCE